MLHTELVETVESQGIFLPCSQRVPSLVIFFCTEEAASLHNNSYGFDDGTVHSCIKVTGDGTNSFLATDGSIKADDGVSDALTGSISVLGSDGFTITWSIVGTMTATVLYLALP